MNKLRYVFCGGMYRSGSTLQYNIVSETLERLNIGRREKWVDDHVSYFSETSHLGIISFKSHRLSPEIKDFIQSGYGIVVSCFRDIRDVVASWQAKNKTPLSTVDGLNLAERAITRYSEWEKLPCKSFFCSKYEDIIADIRSEVLKIAGFMRLNLKFDDLNQISESVTAATLQNRLNSLPPEMLTCSGTSAWDTNTLIHVDHFNGGIVGRYKTELEPELLQGLNERYGHWLSDHGYQLE